MGGVVFRGTHWVCQSLWYVPETMTLSWSMGAHDQIGAGMDEPGQKGWGTCGLGSEYRFVLNIIAISKIWGREYCHQISKFWELLLTVGLRWLRRVADKTLKTTWKTIGRESHGKNGGRSKAVMMHSGERELGGQLVPESLLVFFT